MTLIEFFKKVIEHLEQNNIRFALAGGLVASIYRDSPRTTQDIDLVIHSQDPLKTAKSIIESFMLEPSFLRKADLEGGPMLAIKRKSTPVWIVLGRNTKRKGEMGLDILLPEIPWAGTALERAQDNAIEFGFGFGPVPCLTVEDLIVSKVHSVNNQSTRFKDLDDLQSIFKTQNELDLAYLCAQMKSLNLNFPEPIEPLVPKEALKILASTR